LLPALINLSLVGLARWLYPRPQDMESSPPAVSTTGFPRIFWVYLGGAALVAAGFADYPVIAYHFSKAHVVPGDWIAIFYAVAMGVSGTGSLVFGRLFDRFGFGVLIGLTVLSALFAPLVFLGGFWLALAGAAVWGLGMGVHESIIPAAVAPMVPMHRRASAFGLFTAGYGIFWFLGSALIGILYDLSVPATILFCVLAELSGALVFIVMMARQEAWETRSAAS
jgi:MFS family permease